MPPRKPHAFRPAATPFKQQTQRAWQPVLSPASVIPLLWLLAVVFAPLGGVFLASSDTVRRVQVDYSSCDAGADSSVVVYSPPSEEEGPAQLRFEDGKCFVRFNVPWDMQRVFFYYRLTSFRQNHRRYLRSVSLSQLAGDAPDRQDLDKGDCKPITSREGKPVYPCGLMANSFFNDTFSVPRRTDDNSTFDMTERGIVWENERKRYKFPSGYASNDSVVPPPTWAARFPRYDDDTPIPDLSQDEHFQVWMRPAAYQDFDKLYMKNEHGTMRSGEYEVAVDMHYPVTMFGGTKSIVLSTVAWTGGRNGFLGWSFVGASIAIALTALYFTIRQIFTRNPKASLSQLSWNRDKPPT